MRFGKALLVTACAALFLLLLSTLVVVSPELEPCAPQSPAPLLGARLLPLALPAQSLGDLDARRPPTPRVPAPLLPLAAYSLPALGRKRDANGRVLRTKRYENSFYQVFRQEIAGG